MGETGAILTRSVRARHNENFDRDEAKGESARVVHSAPQYIQLPTDNLLASLLGMFFHQTNKITLRHRFEERSWKRTKTFYEYVHEKSIMGNRIAIEEDELLGYIIG